MRIKHYIYTLVGITLWLNYRVCLGIGALNETSIDPRGDTIVNRTTGGRAEIQNYLVYIKELLFTLLWIIVVGAFIYIGYMFVKARGNPEEFKKAWMHTIYIIVGIALVSSAWGIVSLFAGLDF